MTPAAQIPAATLGAPSHRLRIALVAPDFPPEVGGMQTYAVEFASELVRAGHEVTVFAKEDAVLPAGLDVRLVRGLKLRRRLDLPLFAQYAPDVWHVLNAGYVWLASHRSPVFASIHGNDFLSPWVMSERLDLRQRLYLPFGTRVDNFLGRRMTARSLQRGFARIRHTFANSQFCQAAFLARYPGCRGRVSVTHLGVSPRFDSQQFPTPRSSPIPRLVTVCRLTDPRKNVDLVLRALAALRPEFEFYYTVVGEGNLRPGLEELARSLGLSDRVRFLGRLAEQDVVAQIAASDLFVLTAGASNASVEGFGIVYLEANACGVPVLAARCGGAVDAVEEGVSGFFVERPEPAEIAAALARYFRGEVSFTSNGCRSHSRRFTWASVCERVTATYANHLPDGLSKRSGHSCPLEAS